jgi:hypothetical protein
MATQSVKHESEIYKEFNNTCKGKDYFGIIAVGAKVIMKWISKTGFEGVDWVYRIVTNGRFLQTQ